jgi:hypothetical protein
MQTLCDGFDHYGYDAAGRAVMIAGGWNAVHATLAFPSLGPAAGPRTGIGCLECRTANPANTQLARTNEFSDLFEIFTSQALYLDALPNNNNAMRFLQYDSNLEGGAGTFIATVAVTSEGNITLRTNESGTLLAETTIPPLAAGKWYVLEIRFVHDAVNGAFAVRVTDTVRRVTETVLAVSGLNTTGNNDEAINFLNVKTGGATSEQIFYLDDWIVRDATGDFNNNFMGPLHVGTLHPNADTTIHGWARFGTSTDWEAVAKTEPDDTTYLRSSAAAFDILTFRGQPRNGETVTLGVKVYTFKTAISVANDVLIGATIAESIANLVAAINDDGVGEGSQYGTGTTANADAGAEVASGTTILATALAVGTSGNSIALADTVRYASWSGTTMTGGGSIPDPVELVLPDPLDEMKTIKSITLDHRSYKGDANDLSLLASLVGPRGVIVDGTTNPIIITPTHYRDTFNSDPDSGAAMSRATMFGARIHMSRSA